MAVDSTISRAIATGDLEPVEDAWLSHLEGQRVEIPFFAEILALVAEHGIEDEAEYLVELLVDFLETRGAHDSRLELLRRSGEILYPDASELHAVIVETLEKRSGDHSSFRELLEWVGLHRAPEDIPKSWKKVDKLLELLAYDVGQVVVMKDKGSGKVVDINFQLDGFRVELPDIGVVTVGFNVAPKMLDAVSEDHVFHRMHSEPEKLKRLARESPEELVGLVLESHDEPLTANDIRTALGEIVDPSDWSTFWSTAKKSPKILALPGGRQQYGWAATEEAALEHLRRRFDASNFEEQLDLLEVHGDRDESLRNHMVASLRKRAEAALPDDPIHAFVVGLSLERVFAGAPGEPWSPDTLLSEAPDPTALVLGLSDPLHREEGWQRLVELEPGAAELFSGALAREADPRCLDILADALLAADPEVYRRTVGEILAGWRKNPATFTWLAERAAFEETVRSRSPLRLLQQILTAIGDTDFVPYRKRLLRLLESGSTVPRILPHLDAEKARSAEDLVERAAGLDDFQKKPLLNAIHLKFPELRKSTEEAPLYAIPESIETKREELRKLLEEEIPANRKAIEEARELGDLRENFEYKSARQRHEYLSARGSKLAADLERARPIPTDGIDTSTVRVGTRVELEGSKGGRRSYTILGPWESDPESGVLSNESDLAQTLLSLEVGDTVDVDGSTFTVAEILPHRS